MIILYLKALAFLNKSFMKAPKLNLILIAKDTFMRRQIQALLLLFFTTLLFQIPLSAQQFEDSFLSAESVDTAREKIITLLEDKYGITNNEVLRAMETVPREEYLPSHLEGVAYTDSALPISNSSVLPSPSTTAVILTEARNFFVDRVLIVGRGTAYLADLFSEIGDTVYTIEYNPAADIYAPQSRQTGVNSDTNGEQEKGEVFTKREGNLQAWSSEAPFDCIVIHGAVKEVKAEFFAQLSERGIIIAPLFYSSGFQQITIYEQSGGNKSIKSIGDSMFRDAPELY